MQIFWSPSPTIVGNSQASKNGSLKMKILLPSQNFRLSYHRKTQKSSVKQFFKLLPFSISFLTRCFTNGPTQKVVRETSSNSYTTENERISPQMELFQKEMNHLPTIDLQGIFVTRSHLPLNLVPAAWFGICERGFG